MNTIVKMELITLSNTLLASILGRAQMAWCLAGYKMDAGGGSLSLMQCVML